MRTENGKFFFHIESKEASCECGNIISKHFTLQCFAYINTHHAWRWRGTQDVSFRVLRIYNACCWTMLLLLLLLLLDVRTALVCFFHSVSAHRVGFHKHVVYVVGSVAVVVVAISLWYRSVCVLYLPVQCYLVFFYNSKRSAPVWMREISYNGMHIHNNNTQIIYIECRSNVKHFLTTLV